MRSLIVIICAALIAFAVRAETLPGPINARVIRVLDGDTLEVTVKIWFDQEVTTRIRLTGVDTPEIKGKCQQEITKALAAKKFTETIVPVNSHVTLYTLRPDKYAGRTDAGVALSNGADLAQALISNGFARPYKGGARKSWCQEGQ